MKRVGVKHYIFAGLDFIFDHEGNPWFLEANSAPQGILQFTNLYGERLPKEIAKYMLRQGNDLCVLTSSGDQYDEKRENRIWIYHSLKKHIPNLRLCYIQKNKRRTSNLMDSNGELFKPDCIFRNGFCISRSFERRTCVINPILVRNIVRDKLFTVKIVKKKVPKIRIPRTFFVKNTKELKQVIKENTSLFKNGYVVKPVDEQLGIGVHVLSSLKEKVSIRKPELLEQRIVPDLIHRKYWDLRVFVLNGKFLGGEMRESIHRITNFHLGAKAYKVPASILKKIRRPSEEIVKAIDNEARKKFKSDNYYWGLKRKYGK